VAAGLKLGYPVNDAASAVVRARAGWTAVGDAGAWDALLRRARRASFTQSWAHGEGLLAEGWKVRRLVFGDGEPVALCQVRTRRVAGFPVARVDGGPVFLRDDPRAVLAVLRALRRRWRFGLRGLLLLGAALPDGEESRALLRAAGFWFRRADDRSHAPFDLRLTLDELQDRFAPDWRMSIRRARKLGFMLRLRRDAAALDWLLERPRGELHAGELADRTPRFFRAAFDARPQDFWLLQAMRDGHPDAAVLLARTGPAASIVLAWAGPGPRRSAAVDFLLWNSAIEMQRAGCQTLETSFGAERSRITVREAGEWLAL